jgi:uncharacterized protein (DUF849 family)
MLKACLNGARAVGCHPMLPVSAAQLAREGALAVAAGAGSLHIHPRDASGDESLWPDDVAAAVDAVRAACPRTPVGVTTGAWIEPDPDRRLALIATWGGRPDFASVNFSEDGAEHMCELLLQLGVGIEPGLATPADAERLLSSGYAEAALRILLEPLEPDLQSALGSVITVERMLRSAGVTTSLLTHGTGPTAWPVLRAAYAAGHDMRIGFEDTLELADGTPAKDNAELVAAAFAVTAVRPPV